MGAGQSDLYKGTYGDNPGNIPDELKDKVKLPKNESQLKHIFRNEEGHLKDTQENRKMLLDLANDTKYHVGKDLRGLDWHYQINDNGTQDWVSHRNGIISDGGTNNTPREFNPETGLNRNVKNTNEWRKK